MGTFNQNDVDEERSARWIEANRKRLRKNTRDIPDMPNLPKQVARVPCTDEAMGDARSLNGTGSLLDRVCSLVVDHGESMELVYYIAVRTYGIAPTKIAEAFDRKRETVTRTIEKWDYRLKFWKDDDLWQGRFDIIADIQATISREVSQQEKKIRRQRNGER